MNKQITLDDLILELIELQFEGYGKHLVSANMEYKVCGVSIYKRTNEVDFDCYM